MDEMTAIKKIAEIPQSVMLLVLLGIGTLIYSIPSLMGNTDPADYSLIMALLTTMAMAFVFLREFTSVKP